MSTSTVNDAQAVFSGEQRRQQQQYGMHGWRSALFPEPFLPYTVPLPSDVPLYKARSGGFNGYLFEPVDGRGGVPIWMCMSWTGLKDPEALMFKHDALPATITAHLKWKGYPDSGRTVSVATRDKAGDCFTRRALAQHLGHMIIKFVADCSNGTLQSTDWNWSFGDHGKYSLNHILLQDFYTLDGGRNWYVGIMVLMPAAEYSKMFGLF